MATETVYNIFAAILDCTVQLPGASLALIEVLLTDYKNWLQTNKQTENRKQTDSGVYRVAPATKNKESYIVGH